MIKKGLMFLLLIMCMTVICSCENNETPSVSTNPDETLGGDEFTGDESLNEEFPDLLDASNVGVIEEKFYNERLYGSESLTISHVINASEYGVDGSDKMDDTLALIAAIEAAGQYTEQGLVQIKLPKGDLDLIEQINPVDNKYGVVLRNAKNLVISGDETNIYFHGEIKGFIVENCENIYFENINIDYGVPPTSTGTILENDGKTFKVRVHDGYVVDETTRISAFLEFNKTSYTPRTKGNDIYGDVQNVVYLGDNVLEITFNSQYSVAPEGTLVALRHYLYENDLFFVNKSKDIHFETMNIYSAMGMGVRAYSTENLYFNNFNFTLKPDTDRLMTATADAIHTIDCYGEVKITNCLFENVGDDAANVHSMYLEIRDIMDSNKIYAINPRGYNFIPSVGDTIEINTTFDMTLVYSGKVKSVVDKNPGFEIEFEEPLDERVETGMVVGNVTRSPKFEFSNNIVRNKRCRGVLVQTRDVVISNNTFANLSDAGVLLTGDANNWYEAITPENVVIKNNKFLKNNFAVGNTGGDISISIYGKGYNLASVGTVKNVEIYNNFFGNSANAGIYANSIKGLKIHHNYMNNVGISPKTALFEAGIYIAHCEDIELNMNVVNKNDSLTFKPIYVGAGVNTDTVQLGKNTGFGIDDIVSKVVSTEFDIAKIEDGSTLLSNVANLDDWSHIPDNLSIVGASDVDQTEMPLNDSTFKVNHMKIAYDSKGIYIAYDVYDNDLLYSATSSYWEGDGVEIFMTAENESKDPLSVLKLTDDSCLQLFMSPNNDYGNQVVELRTSSNIFEQKSLVQMVFIEKSSADGYIGKVFIPFELIPQIKGKLDNNEQFSFAINFSDSDYGAIRVQYATVSHPVEFNKYVPYSMSKVGEGE